MLTWFIATVCLVFYGRAAKLEDDVHDWGYYDAHVTADERQESWKDYFPYCGGKRQSPIHIYKSQVEYEPNLGEIKFEGYDEIPSKNFSMRNNGHTLVFSVHSDHYISEGGLPGRFKLAQFHFHWGSGNNNGSEHWVDDRHYAAEIHLVHYNLKYGSLENALEEPDGLAVLGSIMAVQGKDNTDLEDIVRHLHDVEWADSPPTDVKAFPLVHVMADDHQVYYRYNGSLTTPPCYESVIWTVFEEPIFLSQYQIDHFRNELHHSVRAETGTSEDYALVDNHRLPQELHGRTVYTNVDPKETKTSSASVVAAMTGMIYSVTILARTFIF